MPVKRRNPKRRQKVTPEAVEAFRARDFAALHLALGLGPWEASPLPASITPLGVDPADRHSWGEETWRQAVALQARLQEAAA
ncbi:hypothetical protein [Mesorhizobium sp. CN2-181]|uniref:hypothetical protein n=1 Tax=Mesorhizobium yinganensis TaxID=3157707 RepID=UPI0032B82FF1